MAKIIIFGTTEIGELAHYYYSNDTEHEVVCFTLDQEFITNNSFMDLPVVPFDTIEEHYSPNDFLMFIGVGYTSLNQFRATKYDEAKSKGYSFVNYVSSKANVFDNVKLGDNCFILEDNTVQPFVEIGNNVFLWSGNHIGHHSKINDHVFITSHVVVSGNCVVDERTFIGVNATLRDGLYIGKANIIAPGAIMLHNTEDNQVYKLNAKGTLSNVPSSKVKL
jgi:sugar O-acyltransferase (sialic acid O-acetyltransferase NeuD family)